jgi:hypothetical protein
MGINWEKTARYYCDICDTRITNDTHKNITITYETQNGHNGDYYNTHQSHMFCSKCFNKVSKYVTDDNLTLVEKCNLVTRMIPKNWNAQPQTIHKWNCFEKALISIECSKEA